MMNIVPLSKELLDDATVLIDAVFPYKPDQNNARWSFKDTLTNPTADKTYWLALNDESVVIVITGLYMDHHDKNSVWLGWFGVHPKFRRQHIGSTLLEFTIAEAIRHGFSILKLYTSTDENEKAAHELYRKHGFIQDEITKSQDELIFVKKLMLIGQYQQLRRSYETTDF